MSNINIIGHIELSPNLIVRISRGRIYNHDFRDAKIEDEKI